MKVRLFLGAVMGALLTTVSAPVAMAACVAFCDEQPADYPFGGVQSGHTDYPFAGDHGPGQYPFEVSK